MKSNEDEPYIKKVVTLDTTYKFEFEKILIWNFVVSQNIALSPWILIFEI